MHRWKLSALAAAAFVSAALTPTDASALALGRIAVQSALGEPLRAEIDIPQVTPTELEALQAGIATPDIFKAQGMDYSSAARQIKVEVVRQPDGTAKLRLSTAGPVSDPFVDLVVDANWSAGHLVRSYTLLLDPPQAQRPAPSVTAAPQISPARTAAKPAAPATPATQGRDYTSEGATPASQPAAAAASGDAVTVRSGDTAGRIAGAHRPAGVSLDQMLVAMQRANPNAFINGNVNRLRAGSVVQMPSRDAALGTSVKEARQIVAAQSRDFNEFRRRMAGNAPEAKVAAAERASSGQVQAQVQDNAAAAAAADKLTLSKGAVKNQHAAEEKLAQAKQASAQAERTDELQRNLAELQKVASASSSPAAPAGAPAPAAATPAAATTTAPGLAVPAATAIGAAATDTPASAPTPEAAVTAPEAAASDAPSAEASASAADAGAAPAPAVAEAPAPVAAKPVVPPAPPAPEPSFLEELTGDNPLVLPAAGGVLALLLGLVGWRAVQRRRAQAAGNAALSDSQLPPDSFFGHSGGQQVDTRHSAAGTGSTMAYSPSQLDAGGDVDPVAEAEVYLAYGRDVQAEEILKEALRTQPERLGVHMKLAEIYAKRKDAKSLEAAVLAVQPLTQSIGTNWEHVQELGRGVDPTNPLYQPPAAPSTSAFADALAKNTTPVAAGAAMGMVAAPSVASRLPADLDLNLDMDLPGGLADDIAPDVEGPASVLAPSDQDFAALEPSWNPAPVATEPTFTPEPAPAAPEVTPAKPLDLGTLAFSLDETPPTPVAAPAADAGLAFDLGGLDLDLGDDAAPAPSSMAAAVIEDPLATKLDLAREFHAIGDSEGARTLVEEVIAEASGDLKTRAQHLLTEID